MIGKSENFAHLGGGEELRNTRFDVDAVRDIREGRTDMEKTLSLSWGNVQPWYMGWGKIWYVHDDACTPPETSGLQNFY
jgi:hypothetical protein